LKKKSSQKSAMEKLCRRLATKEETDYHRRDLRKRTPKLKKIERRTSVTNGYSRDAVNEEKER